MANTDITLKGVSTLTINADNTADEERKYTIKAKITIENGKVQSVNHGQVYAYNVNVTEPLDVLLCAFGITTASDNLWLNIYGVAAQSTQITEAVYKFIEDVKGKVAETTTIEL